MRTLIIIVAGIVFWLACFAVVRWRGDPRHVILPRVTIGFVVAWFVVAAVNLWIGVNHAGYTFIEELPIALLIFLVPASVAVLTSWREWGRAKRIGNDAAP